MNIKLSNHNFRCDSLTIHDGGTNQATELGKFCGNKSNVQQILFLEQDNVRNVSDLPIIMYSTQNKMWIR